MRWWAREESDLQPTDYESAAKGGKTPFSEGVGHRLGNADDLVRDLGRLDRNTRKAVLQALQELDTKEQ